MDIFFVVVVLVIATCFIIDVRQKAKGNAEGCDYCDGDCECEFFPNIPTNITQNIYRNRKGQRQRVGVLVSCNKGGNVKIGYSLCNKEDKFDSKEAYIRAGQRMSETVLSPPPSLGKDLDVFIDRCHRYYKGANIATYNGLVITNP